MHRPPIKRFGNVRADSALWIGIALLLFAISGILTLHITSVKRNPPQNGIELAFDDDPKADVSAASPEVRVISEGGYLDVVITKIDPHFIRTIKIGPALDDYIRCASYPFGFIDSRVSQFDERRFLPTMRPSTNFEEYLAHISGSSFADISVAQLPGLSESPGDVTVMCEIRSTVVHDTYTSRSFIITMRGTPNPLVPYEEESLTDAAQFSLDEPDAEEIHVTDMNSGETRLASRFTVGQSEPKDFQLKFTWESITAAQRRDVYIVVIGSLIALGAAAAIEAARPYIDQLFSEATSETHNSAVDLNPPT
jgi:hypothetical protein